MSLRPSPGSPAARGYRMPAEWERHAATWIAWPHERTDWPGPGKLEAVRWVYAEFIRQVVRGERIRMLVQDATQATMARRRLRATGVDMRQVDLLRLPTDRSWTRDSLPIYLCRASGRRALVNFHFNGWAKYPNWKRDDAAAASIVRRAKLPAWTPMRDGRRIVLEGGAIDVNGRGTLLTTEECLLSPVQARNPGFDRAQVEQMLADHLGATHVVWLGEGISGDDTHGHVDDLARFVDPRTVVVAQADDRAHPDYHRLRDARRRLARATDERGRALRVVPLPMPEPLAFEGQHLPASYANFYVTNAAVLMPTFNDPNDRVALATLATCFPRRRVVGIHAVDLVLGLGTLHCMTQQEPASRTQLPSGRVSTQMR